MTKRPDDPADAPEIEEGATTTAERRRRRRRGAGLRVPSDNVPRRTAPQPVVAPVPEDPNLAVSIAYSFGTDSAPDSLAVPRPDDSNEFAKAEAEAAALIGAEGTDVRPRGGGVPLTAAATAVAAATPDQLGDVVADGRTREMPAAQLEALGLEDPSPHEGGGNGASTAGAAPVDADAAPDDEPARPVRSRASTVALDDDDLEEVLEPMRAGKAGIVAAEAPRRGAVDVAAFDDHSSPSLPTVHYREPASEDLEESWDDEPALPIVDKRDTLERAATDPDAAENGGVVARPVEGEGSEDIALDDEDLQDEVQVPADASDSGEILSDELIEEVESQTAQPVPLREAEGAAAATQERAAASPPAEADKKADDKPANGDKKPPLPAPVAAAAGAAPVKAPPPAPPKKPGAARAAAAVAAAVTPAEQQAARDERRRRAKPWFEEIFDEDYLRTLPFLTPQATQGEAQFVIDALGLAPGAQVLDLGCGYGRHAMELAARGYHVVGLDLSLPLLLRGADEAQRRGLTINFVHGDMRELDFDSQFDGAYCVFSTFGYFDDETNKKTATNLARALKPGAKVVLDILNRDYLIADLPTRVWWEGDGCVVLEEVDFNYFSSRIQTSRSVVFDDGRQVEQEISLRAYSLHEIGKLLHSAGFRVLEISGSMVTRGRFFGATSRHIIVVAERRPKDPATEAPKA